MWKFWVLLAVYVLLGRLPVQVRYAVARLLADAVYRARPGLRAALRDNMRHVLGPTASDEDVERAARQVARNAGRYYADLIAMPRLNPHKLYRKGLRLEGLHYVQDATAAGRGVVLVSAHYGNPEMAVQALAAVGIHVFAFTEPLRPPALSRLTHKLRNRHHEFRTVNLANIREAMRRLRGGGVVCILCDRDIQGRGIEVEFLGGRLRVPPGAVELAMRTNAELIPAWVRRVRGFRLHAVIGPPLPLERTGNHDRDLLINTQRLLRRFEPEVRRDPTQWFVLERLWPCDDARAVASRR
jgi:lauroyl/myristoyl acyltransferase